MTVGTSGENIFEAATRFVGLLFRFRGRATIRAGGSPRGQFPIGSRREGWSRVEGPIGNCSEIRS